MARGWTDEKKARASAILQETYQQGGLPAVEGLKPKQVWDTDPALFSAGRYEITTFCAAYNRLKTQYIQSLGGAVPGAGYPDDEEAVEDNGTGECCCC